MVVSFSVILELFKNQNKTVNLYKENKILNARIATRDESINPSYIYLTKLEDFYTLKNKGNGSFIVIDPDKLMEKTKLSKNYNLIIIEDDIDPAKVINSLNNLFASMKNFENTVLLSLIEDASIKEILDLANKNLGLRLTLNDKNNNIITRNFSKESTRLKSNSYRLDTILIGSISLYDNMSQDKLCQKILFEGFVELIDKSLTSFFLDKHKAIKDLASKHIVEFIQGKNDDARTALALKEIAWANEDKYLLFYMKNLTKESEKNLSDLIESTYEDAALFIKFNGIYMVLANIRKVDKEIFISEIHHTLSSDPKSLCLLSKVIDSFIKLGNVFSFLEKISYSFENGWLNLEEDLFKAYVYSSALDDNFILDSVKELYEYDKEKEDSLFETLYAFLINERSHVKTSKALSVHRNTVVYRINKVEAILDLDLEDAHTRLSIIISCLGLCPSLYKFR